MFYFIHTEGCTQQKFKDIEQYFAQLKYKSSFLLFFMYIPLIYTIFTCNSLFEKQQNRTSNFGKFFSSRLEEGDVTVRSFQMVNLLFLDYTFYQRVK